MPASPIRGIRVRRTSARGTFVARTTVRCVLVVLCVLAATASTALAQSNAAVPKKLPTVERIVSDYLKAIGGKKTVVAQRDAIYEWTVKYDESTTVAHQTIATARALRKAPASERFELMLENGQFVSGTNSRSAWEIGFDKRLRTLTTLNAATAKLHAALAASRLIDFKKANILARVLSLGDLGSEPAYIVEFSTRSGARVHYYFSVKTKLITKITSDAKKTRIVFDDYRTENGILEPHRVRMTIAPSNGIPRSAGLAPSAAGPASADRANLATARDSQTVRGLNESAVPVAEFTLVLQSVKYNTGLDDQLFDPPAATQKFDITSLLLEVGRNQDATENRVAEYSFKQTETDREISSKGELKKQTVKVYEVYPLLNREPVEKLISENGVPLSAERAAKEEKRVQEEFLKAEREKDKDAADAAKRKAEREKKKAEREQKTGQRNNDEDNDPAISMFLRACDFVSPRLELFEGRESIVFDFRPRAGFKPKTREESLIAKLVGVVWIDPVDKQVMRLEARLAEGFKIAGGLVASLKPGAALVMEQTRMEQGVWLPRFAQINLSVKVLLFGGGDYNKTIEWSDYKHFSGDVKDYKIEAPASVRP
jgi:hypothetical protein